MKIVAPSLTPGPDFTFDFPHFTQHLKEAGEHQRQHLRYYSNFYVQFTTSPGACQLLIKKIFPTRTCPPQHRHIALGLVLYSSSYRQPKLLGGVQLYDCGGSRADSLPTTPAMANSQGQPPKLDRYVVIHAATTCDEHGVYVTKDSAEVIELGWILLDAKSCEEVCANTDHNLVFRC